MAMVHFLLASVQLSKFILEVNKNEDQIAQVYTYTQRHMNNVWSEVVSSTPYLVFYYSFSAWFIQTILDNSYATPDHS